MTVTAAVANLKAQLSSISLVTLRETAQEVPKEGESLVYRALSTSSHKSYHAEWVKARLCVTRQNDAVINWKSYLSKDREEGNGLFPKFYFFEILNHIEKMFNYKEE